MIPNQKQPTEKARLSREQVFENASKFYDAWEKTFRSHHVTKEQYINEVMEDFFKLSALSKESYEAVITMRQQAAASEAAVLKKEDKKLAPLVDLFLKATGIHKTSK